MKLANLYMANGQYTEAEDVLDSIPVYYNEVQQFKNLRYMQLDLLENNETIEDLNGDELGILSTIAESNTQAGWQAKAILIALGEDTIPFDIEDRIYASPKKDEQPEGEPVPRQTETVMSKVLVYPNPADNSITIEYSIEGNDGREAVFRLYNLIGGENLVAPLKELKGRQVVDISSLNNGVYLYEVVNRNQKLCQDKLVIVR